MLKDIFEWTETKKGAGFGQVNDKHKHRRLNRFTWELGNITCRGRYNDMIASLD